MENRRVREDRRRSTEHFEERWFEAGVLHNNSIIGKKAYTKVLEQNIIFLDSYLLKCPGFRNVFLVLL
jgi:hypothetical protein